MEEIVLWILGCICMMFILFVVIQNSKQPKEPQAEIENKDISKTQSITNDIHVDTPIKKSITLILTRDSYREHGRQDFHIQIKGAKIYKHSNPHGISNIGLKSFDVSWNNFYEYKQIKTLSKFYLDVSRSKEIVILLTRDGSNLPEKYILKNINDVDEIILNIYDEELSVFNKGNRIDVIKAELYPVFQFSALWSCDERNLIFNVDGATILYSKKEDIAGLKKIDKNTFELFPKQVIKPSYERKEIPRLYNDIYLDIGESKNVSIEIKNENGSQAKFVLQKVKNIDKVEIELDGETSKIISYWQGKEIESNNAIFSTQQTVNDIKKIKTKFVWMCINKLFEFVEQYSSILSTKYKQFVYTNEWGEIIGQEKFDAAVNHFFGIVENNCDYDKTKEYKDLKQLLIDNYFINPSYFLYYEDVILHEYDFEEEFKNIPENKIKKKIIDKLKDVGIEYEKLENNVSVRDLIESYIRHLVQKQDKRTKSNNKDISPIDYEKQIAIQLKDLGFNAHTTKASGDQGADVLADKQGVKFAIQCKMYSKPVGNKAVQEVNAARDYYKCDYGVVITNSSYTPAARKAANACGVILLNDNQLEKLNDFVED
jgi:HJR/Mrr/RecB family endonuclease